MSLAMGLSMIRGQHYVSENAWKIKAPTLISVGGGDTTISSPETVDISRTMNTDSLKFYEGAYHCLHEELPETTKEYMHDLKEWIIKQLIVRPVTGVSASLYLHREMNEKLLKAFFGSTL